ncbi:hypothetical protein Efla_003763 [Eimeria flavescens]
MQPASEPQGPPAAAASEGGPPAAKPQRPSQTETSASGRPPRQCLSCGSPHVQVARMGGLGLRCKNCFCAEFEAEVWRHISTKQLLPRGCRVCVCVSGGKDSAVLLHVLHELNRSQQQQWQLCLLAIDEGIAGYRDHALEAVRQNSKDYNLPLKILSYAELYSGWTMDHIHTTFQQQQQQRQQQQQQQEKGFGGYCSYCGVFRRQALERGARLWQAACLATGHNLEDAAETVLLNLTRGDLHRLFTSANPGSSSSSKQCSGSSSTDNSNSSSTGSTSRTTGSCSCNKDSSSCNTDSSSSSTDNSSSSSTDNSSSSSSTDNSSSSRTDNSSSSSNTSSSMRRCKPLLQCYQKEIVLYAHFKRLRHFATECTYSSNATRGKPRELLTALQAAGHQQRIRDIVRAASSWLSLLPNAQPAASSCSSSSSSSSGDLPCCSRRKEDGEEQQQQQQRQRQLRQQQQGQLLPCRECGALTTNALCRACTLVSVVCNAENLVAGRLPPPCDTVDQLACCWLPAAST